MIDPAATEVITKELSARERLIWAGTPQQGIIFRSSDAFLIPFSLLWCGFAVFWEAGVLKTTAPFFFKLFGIPFVLVGLYFVFGRFVVDARQRVKTYYGITNERAVIVSGLFQKRIKTLNLDSISDISLTERPDRRGTITFGPTPSFFGSFGGWWPGMGQPVTPSFEMIEEAREVYTLLNQTREGTLKNS